MPRYLREPRYRDYGGYADDPYVSRSSAASPISRLLLQRGEDMADAELLRADIWGETAQNLGKTFSESSQGLGQYLTAEKTKKEEKAKVEAVKAQEAQRAQALNTMLEKTGGKPGPRDFINIYGLERGLEIGKAWSTFTDKSQKVNVPVLARGVLALDDESAAAGWPSFLQRVDTDYPGSAETAPKEWNRGWVEKMLPTWENPNPEFGTATAGSQIYNKGTGAVMSTVPVEEKPDTRSLDLRAEEALAKGDQAEYARIMKVKKDSAAAGREPKSPELHPLANAPVEWRDVVRTAGTAIAIKNRRDEFYNHAAELISDGNIPQLQHYVKSSTLESEPVDIRNTVVGRWDMNDALRDIKDLLFTLEKAGIDTNKVTGSYEDLLRFLGTTSDPRMVQLKTRLTAAKQKYRRAMTGAVFSAGENAEYTSIFPNYHNDPVVNHALIDSMLEASESQDAAYWLRKLGPDGSALVTGRSPRPRQPRTGARPIPPGARPGQGRGGAIPAPVSTRQGGPVTVQTPGGVFTFPDEASAAAFRREAGL